MTKSHFLVRLNPPRANFALEMTADEAAIMGKHIVYWRGLIDTKSAVLFGPVFDPKGAWGLGILEADDLPAARKLANDDPAILANVGFKADVIPMPRTTLRG